MKLLGDEEGIELIKEKYADLLVWGLLIFLFVATKIELVKKKLRRHKSPFFSLSNLFLMRGIGLSADSLFFVLVYSFICFYVDFFI